MGNLRSGPSRDPYLLISTVECGTDVTASMCHHPSVVLVRPREKPQPVKGFEFHVKRRRIGARSWAALLAKETLFTEAASGFDLQLIMPDQTLAEGGRNQRARTSFVGSEGSDGVGVMERITDSSKEELVVVEEIFTPQIQGKRDPKTP
ncbi:unnamed protein product [Malus baccata var. baccata]